MSIIALTQQKLARESPATGSAAFKDSSEPAKKPSISDAMAVIVSYVPTEVIGAYTLAIATVGDTKAVTPLPMWSFWTFAILTPLFVALLYSVRWVELAKSTPWRLPWWESLSATLAFIVWAAALPRSALRACSWYDSDVAAVVLVGTSIVLPLVGTVVTRRARSG